MSKFSWTDPKTGKEYAYNWSTPASEREDEIVAYCRNDITTTRAVLDYILGLKEENMKEKIPSKMTMAQMNEYLEKRGFIVKRNYLTASSKYRFEITKDGVSVEDYFVYNPDISAKERAKTQIKFLTDLIIKYEKERAKSSNGQYIPNIKNVIFNYPYTIVLWHDGTKTIVKTQNDELYDPEKGLAMAISKKAFGNKGSYYNNIKPWVEQFKPENAGNTLAELVEKIKKIHIPKLEIAKPSSLMTKPKKNESDTP